MKARKEADQQGPYSEVFSAAVESSIERSEKHVMVSMDLQEANEYLGSM